MSLQTRTRTISTRHNTPRGCLHLVPTPKRRKPRLTTLGSVRREMARVYRDAECGKLDSTEASKLAYVLGQLTKVLELTEVERRLNALEAHD